jgi:acetyl-CoA carboxylase/biotin carboxylase 1
MKKLSVANPELSWPERQELLAQFLPGHIRSESEVAEYLESEENAVAAFIQQVRDEFCSRQIYKWA